MSDLIVIDGAIHFTNAVGELVQVPKGGFAEFANADNTVKAYTQAVERYATGGGTTPLPLPASPQHVEWWINNIGPKYKLNTVKLTLSALAMWHTQYKHPDPTKDERVKQALKGFRRAKGDRPTRKKPLLRSLITGGLMTAIEDNHNPTTIRRDRALVLLGYSLLFRRSELANLRVRDIEFDDYGARIDIKPVKHGKDWVVAALPSAATVLDHTGVLVPANHCVVRALREWVEVVKSQTDNPYAPLFVKVFSNGRIHDSALAGDSINLLIKSLCQRAGIENWKEYGGHSMRRGHATDADRAKIRMIDIKEAGRWANLSTVETYIEPSDNPEYETLLAQTAQR